MGVFKEVKSITTNDYSISLVEVIGGWKVVVTRATGTTISDTFLDYKTADFIFDELVGEDNMAKAGGH